MKKVLWYALTLSVLGLLSRGELADTLSPVYAAGSVAKPVSGGRNLIASPAMMYVGRGGVLKAAAKRSPRRHTASRRSTRRRPVTPAALAAQTIASRNTITGIAVVPEETTVRLVIEANEAFTPEVVQMKSGASPATIVRVPGVLSDERGVGSVAVHKNGVFSVRYANHGTGNVQFVAATQVEMSAELTPSVDKKHWEIVLRRPQAEATQVAMDTTGGKGVPVTTAAKKPAAPVVVFKPATGAVISGAKAVKPVTVNLPMAPIAVTAPAPVPATASMNRAGSLAPAPVGQTALPGTGEDKRVSLDFVATDINDVIKALALQSGINVITSTEVKGTVTVSLKRVPMIEALDTITRISGYQYARLNSGYIVASPASVQLLTAVKRNVVLVTDYVRYRYVSSNDLYNTLRSKFPGIGIPAAGDATDGSPAISKLLVITDTAERIAQVRKFVAELDAAASEPLDTRVTELYKIKAANANDLIRLVQQLAPTVIIQVGVSQLFTESGNGQSASFSAGGSFGSAGTQQLGAVAGGAGVGQATTAGQAGGGGAGGSGGVANAPSTLVLTGTPAAIASARAILERIDVRTSQISYEARVVDVNREDLQSLGLRYDFGRQAIIGERNETGQGTIGPTGSTQNAGNPNFGAILRSPYSIGVTLDALANRNRARTLASPNLSAVDGQPATAFIGDQIKYVISIQQTQQGPIIQTETATVGITLKVTGKSSPDGYITLYIHPEVSSITSFRDLANGISLPQISTRFVDTTVRVKSGETIAIGGLLREQDINNLQKVPILGDIPFLGQLFRRSQKNKVRSEIVVFVTARATEDGG